VVSWAESLVHCLGRVLVGHLELVMLCDAGLAMLGMAMATLWMADWLMDLETCQGKLMQIRRPH
jgi:hypothetical protein